MTDSTAPLTSPDCDCTDLDGFMLNVERLMASELVALSSHEAVAAALFLWCRAWKQTPAASLPDNDKVIAAFARLPLAKFKRMKEEVMRGFVKCSDGRYYHRVLAAEATQAYDRKVAFRKKRDGDAERLRNWRRDRSLSESEWAALRQQVFARDGFACTRCGSKEDLHCDHIIEARDGGQSEMSNLATLCRKHHSQKTAFRNNDTSHTETHFVAEGQGQGQGQQKSAQAPSKPKGIDYPDWLPKDAWEGYLAQRKKQRIPLTEHAEKLLISELSKLRAAGDDPKAVLEKATVNGWRSVYPLNGTGNGAAKSPSRAAASAPLLGGEDRDRAALRRFVDHKLWLDVDGEPPLIDGKFNPRCRIPRVVLAEFGIHPERAKA